MLGQPLQSVEASWACAWLALLPKYSPASASALWRWAEQRGVLPRLVRGAGEALARRWAGRECGRAAGRDEGLRGGLWRRRA